MKNLPGRIILFPYKAGSESCKLIAEYLRTKTNKKVLRVFSDGNYRPRNLDLIVNWGNSKVPGWAVNMGPQSKKTMINWPWNVGLSVNKLKTFQTLRDARISHAPFTTDRNEALEWPWIVERHKLESYGGEGIKINEPENLGYAPLYTYLLTPATEYRVHVFNGEIIDYTKKIKRTEDGIKSRVEGDLIKNKEAGWEYLRDVEPRPSVQELAINTIKALGLDFGAVDIIRHHRINYVLEVGTASGLSPMGVEAYGEAILKLIK